MARNSYCADPLSRADIRKMALRFRKMLGLENELYIDVLRILEIFLPALGANYVIVAKTEMEEEARTYPERKEIIVREDVYEGARRGIHRYRLTIIHEIAHLLLHDSKHISLARSSEPLKAYRDPEWQASAFAGEFLMPYDLVKNMTIDEIVVACGVSRSAAETQTRAYRKSR